MYIERLLVNVIASLTCAGCEVPLHEMKCLQSKYCWDKIHQPHLCKKLSRFLPK